MDKVRVAVYCRVSTDSKDQANSFENQKSYFEREINKNPDYELVEIYADRGISGTKLQRPKFDKMLKDAGLDIKKGYNNDNDQRKEYTKYYTSPSSSRKPKFNLIITKNTSRFARNTNVSDILDDLKKNNVYVQFLDLNKTTQNESDITFIKLFQVFDENESRDKSIKVKFGQQEGVKHGVIHTSGKLYGYKYIQAENRLEIIEEEAKVIKLIYTLYASGLGIRQIIKTLDNSGIITRQGKSFCKSTIRRILDNEKYAGYTNPFKYDTGIVFNKNSYPKIKDSYEVTESDKIPAIIDFELFVRCSEILKSKVNYTNQKGIYKGKAKYSGLIRCGNCGSIYHSNTDNGRIFYNCSNKKLHGISVCNNPNINESIIDQYIDELSQGGFFILITDTVNILKTLIFEQLYDKLQDMQKDKSDLAKELKTKIDTTKEELSKYYALAVRENADMTIINSLMAQSEEKLKQLNEDYSNATKQNNELKQEIITLYNYYLHLKNAYIDEKQIYTQEEVLKLLDKIIIKANPNDATYNYSLMIELKIYKDATEYLKQNNINIDQNQMDKVTIWELFQNKEVGIKRMSPIGKIEPQIEKKVLQLMHEYDIVS